MSDLSLVLSQPTSFLLCFTSLVQLRRVSIQGQLTTMLLNFYKLINFCCLCLIAKPTFLESRLIFTHAKKAGVKYRNEYSTYRFLKSAQLHLIKISTIYFIIKTEIMLRTKLTQVTGMGMTQALKIFILKITKCSCIHSKGM